MNRFRGEPVRNVSHEQWATSRYSRESGVIPTTFSGVRGGTVQATNPVSRSVSTKASHPSTGVATTTP